MCVDDILTGDTDVKQAQQRKATAIEIMETMRNSSCTNPNAPELEDKGRRAVDEQSYAKQQLCVKPSESKLLDLKWNKEFSSDTPVIAKVYDPLGLASPITFQGKLIFRDVCDSKIG